MLTTNDIRKALGIPPSIPEFTMTGDEEVPKEEEWIWVEGYKGTNKYMMCRDFHFELGKRFDMPEDEKIEACKSGFHLCTELTDVYSYYSIGDGNRFFKVRALVRKEDYETAKRCESSISVYTIYTLSMGNTKLAAKSIEFIEECTPDEILARHLNNEWTEEDKLDALQHDVDYVYDKQKVRKQEKQTQELVELGYSASFASWLICDDKYDIAYAVGTQKDLSMDMKVLAIMRMN